MRLAPVLALLLAAGPAAAQDAGAGGGRQKGLRIETRAGCMAPGAFEQLLGAGADAWGIEEGEAQRAVDLLAATVQCRAFVAGSDRICDGLKLIAHFPAGRLLAENCRSEHQLLVFYDAIQRREQERARKACEGWYELNRHLLYEELKAGEVCRRAVALLVEDKGTACDRLGSDLSALVKDARERRVAAGLCRAVWTPDRRACAQQGLPMERRACEAYGGIARALRTRDPKDCPRTDRYGGLCRAMIAERPAEACERLRVQWQELICARRFAAGQGGGD